MLNKKTGQRKFDVVIGNPPYQAAVRENGQRGSRSHIWDKFVNKSFRMTEDDGFVCMIHPSGWRRGKGKFFKVGDLIRSKNVKYLELHNVDDGVKTFGATVGYDWYVAKNTKNNELTNVVDCNGNNYAIDLKNAVALPDSHLDEVLSLMAKDGEEKVEFIFSRSAYGHDKKHVQKEKDKEHKYSVIYSLPQSGQQIWWSSRNDNGHFGVPKVIWSNGAATQVLVDEKGKYGLTEWAYGISDELENLPKIKEAMESEKFLDICKYMRFSLDKYDSKFISLFRKDFWKKFV